MMSNKNFLGRSPSKTISTKQSETVTKSVTAIMTPSKLAAFYTLGHMPGVAEPHRTQFDMKNDLIYGIKGKITA